MQKLAENLWIFDGEPVTFLACPFTTRMTVIRLSDGSLWIHSPIKLGADLMQSLSALGQVRYLIAPNHLHHLYLDEWQQVFPKALTYGTDQVIKKRGDLNFNGSLDQEESWPWADEISQMMFTGSRLMQETVFFHLESRTLIVTDLIENFPKAHFNWWQRVLAKGVGILAPNGKTPLDWRLSFNKKQAKIHFEKMKSWAPDKIVLAHGNIIENNGTEFLTRSFAWVGG
ncbi:DUF4336 domain-containing protein [Hahella ganghwensis]|uniref:DUF4336 domain-containing protein n=1 Tax=Hahella ganghwensis TaxID=286420 RepID=UPI00036313DE|nr:DUF4336 domain-containing protein [Hahella ganghwensis]